MSVLTVPRDMAKAIKRGTKTTHRVEAAQGRLRPEVGESMPVQVRTDGRRQTVCRVEVLDVVLGTANGITLDEARAEGHKSRGDFFAWWREHIDKVEPPGSQSELYCDVAVWIVCFQLDQRKFLAARPGITAAAPESDEAHGYVSSPGAGLAGERQIIEPIGPGWNERLRAQRLEAWAKERKTISAALDRLMEDPHMRSEVASEVRVLQRRLAAIDRRLLGEAA